MDLAAIDASIDFERARRPRRKKLQAVTEENTKMADTAAKARVGAMQGAKPSLSHFRAHAFLFLLTPLLAHGLARADFGSVEAQGPARVP